ncbi:class I SAM-dependent methyltransferase [Cryomorpha ignava]|uniref:Class I SAM-dependent methyltransferase n=1 Tax=Cryomorpha ignava TaxID=101383 RepID=A0A7K3WNK1_9FLAO|nr:class I SAM-dependent methyltransferase [Cryomorpha ignava]NEN23230.1 class I SAM-dependent methyltransferase [Cryomorpha ignava]
MSDSKDYLEVNRQTWNEKTKSHVGSDFYDQKNFLAGKSSLNQIELDLLGDVKGMSILHLQCHFGQDSISLSRMGAHVTGIDFSDTAIAEAEKFAKQVGADTRFVCCDVYSLPQMLTGNFDFVFTSYGTIGWLPDIDKWAGVVAHYLKPGGSFIMAEFHPVVWMFDNDFKEIQYRYFNDQPILETETGTYAEKDAPIRTKTITWNHALGEVCTALNNHGIALTQLREFDYSPYNIFPDSEEYEPGKFRMKKFGNKLPLIYALSGIKRD